jgi:hypothetical protein
MRRLCVTAILGVALATSVRSEGEPTLTVQIYDLANVPRGLWQVAQTAANRAFGSAGVRVSWLTCSVGTTCDQCGGRLVRQGDWRASRPFRAGHVRRRGER